MYKYTVLGCVTLYLGWDIKHVGAVDYIHIKKKRVNCYAHTSIGVCFFYVSFFLYVFFFLHSDPIEIRERNVEGLFFMCDLAMIGFVCVFSNPKS